MNFVDYCIGMAMGKYGLDLLYSRSRSIIKIEIRIYFRSIMNPFFFALYLDKKIKDLYLLQIQK